jgi:hypothetical protein
MKATVLSSCLAVAFGLASAWEYRELHAERARAALLASRIADLQRRTSQGTTRAGINVEPSPAATALPSDPAVALKRAPEIVSESDVRIVRAAKSSTTPAYHAALRAQSRRMLASTYSDLGEVLHLTPVELDQVLNILAEQATREMEAAPDALMAADEQAGEASTAQQPLAQERAMTDAALASVLGNQKLKQWHGYTDSLEARMEVRRWRADLATTSMPLADDAVEPLVSAIAQQERQNPPQADSAISTSVPEPGGPQHVLRLEKRLDDARALKQRLLEAVQPYVAAEQLMRFDRLLDEQIETTRIDLDMARAQVAASGQ